MTYLDAGTRLYPRGDAYHADWKDTGFYGALEKYRPSNMLAHKEAVFLCDNDEDLDAAGGGTDWVFTCQPDKRIERHDMNWGSEVSCLLDSYPIDSPEIAQAARNYWDGTPSEDPLWEYLTPSALILCVEEF